ncbi:MAG: branched-chain amino acid ABC transporter permease [Deltaproteobacteria bacterium HGW-Deltaproteobacteria-15]|jgi:branched-chain amino acid transport system permease protein|nr:MAG: branched-chain amino acid ABC transporter permease [Deltaproteobacteria bacterium HGW-Deltaproteobacteria-15]
MEKVARMLKWPVLGIIVLALGTVPFWGSEYVLLFCLLFCLYLALSQMWNLLAGYSGLVSLGQQSFIGMGGYAVGIFCNYYQVPLWPSVLLGGAFSCLLALFMSLFIFRMKGVYFSIGSWIFAETLLIWFGNWKYVKYGTGLFIKPPSNPTMEEIYYGAFVIGVGSVILVYALLRSRLGLGLMAMRDDDAVAETMGVKVFRSKLYCFLIGAFVTGATAGILYVFQVFIQPYKAFAIDWTVKLVFIVIIGGIGTIEGPIVGSLIFVLLSQSLAEYFSVSMLILGAIAIAVILLAPKGIMGSLQEKLGFEILSPRRK